MNINNIYQSLVDKIINVAYSDAGITEKIIVHLKSVANKDVRDLLKEYRETASTVHNLKPEEVPENLIRNVYVKTEISAKTANPFEKIFLALSSKPALSSIAIAVIVLLIISLFVFKQPAPSNNYTKAEIELAQIQLAESIAIVNKVFKKAGKKFDEEVMSKHVSKPLNKGLNLLNDYLIGG